MPHAGSAAAGGGSSSASGNGRISWTGIGRAIATTVGIAHEGAALLAVELHEVDVRLRRQRGSERQARSRRDAEGIGHAGAPQITKDDVAASEPWLPRTKHATEPGPKARRQLSRRGRCCRYRVTTDCGRRVVPCTSTPSACRRSTLAFGSAHVFYPEATRRALHRRAAARRRPGRARRGARARPRRLRARPVRQRPAVRRVVVPVASRSRRCSARRWRAAARTGRSWPTRRSRSRRALPVAAVRGGEALLRRLFEPLGYAVDATRRSARRAVPGVGRRPLLHGATCRRRCASRDLLTHLYVLLPVLDDDKHYWVGDDEVEKLLRRGEGWLADAPGARADRRRYLKHQREPRRATRWPGSTEATPTDAERGPTRRDRAEERARASR